MKQEEEIQSRFLISLSFFYCRRWMGPDDEFSLICFRPISEKTRTTSLPSSSILSFTERGPRRLVVRSETSHLNSLQQSRRRFRISIQDYVRMASHTFISNKRFRYETLRDGHSISRSRTYSRKINNSFPTFVSSYEIFIHCRESWNKE